MGVETKYQKNGQSLEDWTPEEPRVSEGTREERAFRRGKDKATADTRGKDLDERLQQVDRGFKEMAAARTRGGGRHATDSEEVNRETSFSRYPKGGLINPQTTRERLGHYKDGGKVQKSSSRRKEEGLDTEIVVEPKKYRKGGKVGC